MGPNFFTNIKKGSILIAPTGFIKHYINLIGLLFLIFMFFCFNLVFDDFFFAKNSLDELNTIIEKLTNA